MQLTGFHHLTAVTANAARNHDFHTRVLGLRLVKKTVNQDDVSAYHLFYADGVASPGSDLTFFEWPVGRERRGTNSIVATGLRLASAESLAWWEQRFRELKVNHNPPAEEGGRLVLAFEDPEGQRYRLVVDETGRAGHPWERSAVPAEHQIVGLGPITLSVPDADALEPVLTQVMNLRVGKRYLAPPGAGATAPCEVRAYRMAGEGPEGELHVRCEPDLTPARAGAGGVHHVAFRTPTAGAHEGWARILRERGVPNSGVVDRFYFRSLYFREPNGILFEIATDGPGFSVDEPMATLGERLALPPFLEPKRALIERGLKPLVTG